MPKPVKTTVASADVAVVPTAPTASKLPNNSTALLKLRRLTNRWGLPCPLHPMPQTKALTHGSLLGIL
jgi:hypothetical protein